MASVALDTVILSLASDLTQMIPLDVSSLSEDDGVAGETRIYANGRVRSITRAGRRRTVPITFDLVQDRATLGRLRTWIGKTVLARDPYGRKLYGVFHGLSVTERIPVDVVEVSLTLAEISYSEAV